MPPLSVAWKTYRTSLPWIALRKLFGKLVRVETLVVYQRDIPSSSPLQRTLDPSTQVIRLGDAGSEIFRRLCRQYPEKKFHERFRFAGQQCFVAMRDNRIAAYAWASACEIYVDEIACLYPVAPGEIFIYDCYVEAVCRGNGIYPAMLEAIVRDFAQREPNVKRAVIAASVLNHASIRGILKAGFTERRRIRYVECLHKQKWWGFDPMEA